MYDPDRLFLLTPGADTGQPRWWYYRAIEGEDVTDEDFFDGADIRPGAGVFITDPSPSARLYWMTREGLTLHPLDIIIRTLAIDAVCGRLCGGPPEPFPLGLFIEER